MILGFRAANSDKLEGLEFWKVSASSRWPRNGAKERTNEGCRRSEAAADLFPTAAMRNIPETGYIACSS
jgi:hypothetical protein